MWKTAAATRTVPQAREHGTKLTLIRLVSYSTNHVVNRIPLYGLRHAWYRCVLGIGLGPGSGLHLGCCVWFSGPGRLRRERLLTIGDHTRINRDCSLDARGPLRIGNNVSVSPEVVILTALHVADDPGFKYETRPVVIEDHVWLATRALVLPGVTIGRGAVVAAGAVVTRDVPPLAVVAGVPARQVGTRGIAPSYVLDDPFPLFE